MAWYRSAVQILAIFPAIVTVSPFHPKTPGGGGLLPLLVHSNIARKRARRVLVPPGFCHYRSGCRPAVGVGPRVFGRSLLSRSSYRDVPDTKMLKVPPLFCCASTVRMEDGSRFLCTSQSICSMSIKAAQSLALMIAAQEVFVPSSPTNAPPLLLPPSVERLDSLMILSLDPQKKVGLGSTTQNCSPHVHPCRAYKYHHQINVNNSQCANFHCHPRIIGSHFFSM